MYIYALSEGGGSPMSILRQLEPLNKQRWHLIGWISDRIPEDNE